jgi:hypothetical protein
LLEGSATRIILRVRQFQRHYIALLGLGQDPLHKILVARAGPTDRGPGTVSTKIFWLPGGDQQTPPRPSGPPLTGTTTATRASPLPFTPRPFTTSFAVLVDQFYMVLGGTTLSLVLQTSTRWRRATGSTRTGTLRTI